MSSDTAGTLAETDAAPRWWGFERHRIVLITLSAALVVDAVVRRRWGGWEWPGALVAAPMVLHDAAGHSWGERTVMEMRYVFRRRVSWITTRIDVDTLVLDVRGTRRVWCYDFAHRGRLDLADRDLALAQRLAHFADSLAGAGESAHLAIHVGSPQGEPARTTLSVTVPAVPAPEWRRSARGDVVAPLAVGRTPTIERRDYLRTPVGVVATLRVSGFSPGLETAALERLSEQLSWLTISLHASVLPAPRGRRMTARAVHRIGSDANVARSAGFRWTARREWELDVLRQREHVVAGGAALCRWALYLVVRAPSLPGLRVRVDEVVHVARAAGLRLDTGVARQAEWFAFQLPGGPGW